MEISGYCCNVLTSQSTCHPPQDPFGSTNAKGCGPGDVTRSWEPLEEQLFCRGQRGEAVR